MRPSGTEPKVKSYIEVRRTCVDGDLDLARADARRLPTTGRTSQAVLARPELAVPRVAEPGHDVGDLVESVVDGRGEQPESGATFSSAAMPSGAHTTQTAVMSTALRACSRPMVCAIDPPVASIGSSTITGWCSGRRAATPDTAWAGGSPRRAPRRRTRPGPPGSARAPGRPCRGRRAAPAPAAAGWPGATRRCRPAGCGPECFRSPASRVAS